MSPEQSDYAGRDYPIEGDPGHDIDQWDEQITAPIQAPPPGMAVLACHCGRVLSASDMRRKKRRPTQSHLMIQPIVCPECAT